MAYDRRDFLKQLGLAAAALPTLAACDEAMEPVDETPGEMPPEEMLPDLPDYAFDGTPGPETLFSHGVASGDPTPDAVILWTRVSAAEAREVWWEISLDAEFERRVQVGTAETSSAVDFTVKVDVTDLKPGTTYYYRFFCLGRESLTGRTRTAPDGPVEGLRFGVVSCSNYTRGYFNVYRRLAEREDLDAVIHLGDYIYEYGPSGTLYEDGSGMNGSLRSRIAQPPNELLSVSDYRQRYATYRTDPDLQAAHQQHPFLVTWDDHESANDAWRGGAQNHDISEGDWEARKQAAIQAYFEWMPIRQTSQNGRVWRALTYGDLVEIVMLDTRLWGRDEQASSRDAHADEARALLGDDQERWLLERLRSTKSTWKIIGQQVMMGQLQLASIPRSEGLAAILNPDQWDGYLATRDRFLEVLRDDDVDNVVVLTGDIHTSWAMDLTIDPSDPALYDSESGEGSLAVEFVTPAVTSSGLANARTIVRKLPQVNPHLKWFDLEKRGYVIVDVKPERVQGDWYHMERIDLKTTQEAWVAGYTTEAGQNRLRPAEAPAPDASEAPAGAPGLAVWEDA